MDTALATASPITFIHADLHGRRRSLRVERGRIAALDGPPVAGERIVDLHGDRVLPGLINAHDHLQLNSLPPPLPATTRYAHVRQWITEVDAQRKAPGPFRDAVEVSRTERILIGTLKNLLCGATTVQHHDPPCPELADPDVPVHVLRDYGWSHSLYIDGEDYVRASHRATPAHWPWIIHAAEGVDAEAALEFERLDALGCLTANTRIVHGVALDTSQRQRLAAAGAGLIWCPSSNLRLFGRTAEVRELVARRQVALGTDSRLSGVRDLLEELRVAREAGGLDELTLERLVTADAARLLFLADRGHLTPGAVADLVVIPAEVEFSRLSRADVRLVMVNGRPRYGAPDYFEQLGSPGSPVRVDGRLKCLDPRLTKLLSAAAAKEVGLDLPPQVR